jgi:hypothetical protein
MTIATFTILFTNKMVLSRYSGLDKSASAALDALVVFLLSLFLSDSDREKYEASAPDMSPEINRSNPITKITRIKANVSG